MEIRIMSNGTLQIDGARICFRNFAGAQTQYNRKGDRNFAVVIPDDELAQKLISDGWNVHIRPPRDADGDSFRYLPIKMTFNDYGPVVYVESNGNLTKLSEENVDVLDQIEIESVSLDVRPYNWTVNGRSGRSAYLKAMKVVQVTDRFAARSSAQAEFEEAMRDIPFQ